MLFRVLVAAIAALILSNSGRADSIYEQYEEHYETPHLEPVWLFDGVHQDSYREAVDAILLKNAPRPHVRLVCLPSFEREWAVSVETSGAAAAEVRLAVAREQIYARFPDNQPERVIVEIHVATIQPRTAQAVRAAWFKMLHNVGAPPKDNDLIGDGVSYVFAAAEIDRASLRGEIVSPKQGSPPSALADLGESLRALTTAAPDARAEMEARIHAAAEKIASH